MNEQRTKAEIEADDEKPIVLAVMPDPIPAELKAVPQWVVWKHFRRDGRWTKIPVDPKTGENALADSGKSREESAAARKTWATFEQAYGAYSKHRNKLAGIGFEFCPDDDFAGVDLDDAIDPATGKIKPWALGIILDFDTYTEISPSGTGFKLYLCGKKCGERCKRDYEDGEVEIYDNGRFFAVTGHRLEVPQ